MGRSSNWGGKVLARDPSLANVLAAESTDRERLELFFVAAEHGNEARRKDNSDKGCGENEIGRHGVTFLIFSTLDAGYFSRVRFPSRRLSFHAAPGVGCTPFG